MSADAGGCNAIWSGSDGPTIPSTTMRRAASENDAEASGAACGGRVRAIRRPAGVWLRPSANWRRTGAACMATWPTRSSAWAMICRIEKVSYKRGPRRFGRSVGMRAPGRFVDAVKCVVARTRTAQLHEIPDRFRPNSRSIATRVRTTRASHSRNGSTIVPTADSAATDPSSGICIAAWLASVLDPIRLTFPSRGQLDIHWQSMEACLTAALEETRQHASAQGLPAPLRHSRS